MDLGANFRLGNRNLDVLFGSTIRKTKEPWLRCLASHHGGPEAGGYVLGLAKEYAIWIIVRDHFRNCPGHYP